MNQHLFSILIANYNNGKYFRDCYDSIIAQTYNNWEAIIIDDASTDDSVEVIKKIIGDDSRFKCVTHTENKGTGYTKRELAESAKGEICAFLDPDDAITTDALSVMVIEHEKNLEAAVIYSNYYQCDEFLEIQHKNTTKQVVNGDPYFFGDGISVFLSYKNSFYEKTDGIDSYLQRAVDRDLIIKLYEVGDAIYLDKHQYKYRIHNGGISTGANQEKAYFWYWVSIINAARRRNINIENFFVENALTSRKEYYLKRELDTYNKSIFFKIFRKLGLFKLFVKS